ncbi:MAG: Rieske (2Fe-2S) protein [Solirubrobacteraceae bacterium]
MSEHPVGVVSDWTADLRRIVTIEDIEIGIVERGGEFFAFENVCPHQGGPVCEGVISGRVGAQVDAFGRVGQGTVSDDAPVIACPWHGVEYDLRTGESISEPRFRLRRYEVERRGDVVYVLR